MYLASTDWEPVTFTETPQAGYTDWDFSQSLTPQYGAIKWQLSSVGNESWLITGACEAFFVMQNRLSAGQYDLNESNCWIPDEGSEIVIIWEPVNAPFLLGWDNPPDLVYTGEPFTLSTITDGDITEYWWFENGVELVGETNSTLTRQVDNETFYNYSVVAVESGGAMASAQKFIVFMDAPPYPTAPGDLAYIEPGNLTFTGGDLAGYKVYAACSDMGTSGYQIFQHSETDTETIFLPGEYADEYVYTIPGIEAYAPTWSDTLGGVFGLYTASFRVNSVTNPTESITLPYTP